MAGTPSGESLYLQAIRRKTAAGMEAIPWTKVRPEAAHEVIAELRAAGKTPKAILNNLQAFVEGMQANEQKPTRSKQRQLATTGMRAGGMPNTKYAAAMQVQALLDEFQAGGNPQKWDKQEARNRLGALAGAMQEANANIKGKLVINFHSGGPFLYPTSTPSDYATLLAAGSKGKAVWHQLHLGPDSHPTYIRVTLDPARIIDQRWASSSWVVFFALYQM